MHVHIDDWLRWYNISMGIFPGRRDTTRSGVMMRQFSCNKKRRRCDPFFLGIIFIGFVVFITANHHEVIAMDNNIQQQQHRQQTIMKLSSSSSSFALCSCGHDDITHESFSFHVYDNPNGTEWIYNSAKHNVFNFSDSLSHFSVEYFLPALLKQHPCHRQSQQLSMGNAKTMEFIPPNDADIYIIPVFPSVLRFGIYQEPMASQVTLKFLDYLKELPTAQAMKGIDHYAVNLWALDQMFHSRFPRMSFIALELKTAHYGVDTSFLTPEGFDRNQHNLVVPYVTQVRSEDEFKKAFATSLNPSLRPYLVVFVGSIVSRPKAKKMRLTLETACKKYNDTKWISQSRGPNVPNFDHLYPQSIFGFSPEGDSESARRTFNLIDAGTIPVIVCDHCIMPYENIINWNKFAIFMNSSFIEQQDPIQFLRSLPTTKVQELQKNLEYARRMMSFNDPIQSGDAIDSLVYSLRDRGCQLKRFKRWFEDHHHEKHIPPTVKTP